MATAYTEKLKLNQWEPSDQFLRTEFNQDNLNLETAFQTLDNRTILLEQQIPNLRYHLYSLLLQAEYAGKYTGFKKGMLFDGFLSADNIQTLSPGLYHDRELGQVRLITQGITSIDSGFAYDNVGSGWGGIDVIQLGNSTTIYVPSVDATLLPTGSCRINTVRARLARQYSESMGDQYMGHVNLSIQKGSTTLGTSDTMAISKGTVTEYTFTFTGGVALDALTTYQLRFNDVENPLKQGGSVLMYDQKKKGPGFIADCTPINYTTGTMTAKSQDIGQSYSQAIAWIRHSGRVGISIRSNSGTLIDMVPGGTRQTKTVDGSTSCTESTFTLPEASSASNRNVSVSLLLDATAGACTVYDYGVIFL